MNALPEIHLCIQQPPGYVHSLGLLDQARYFRYQFRRLGAQVSLGKNRLRHDALNFVFGAHLGFEAAQRSHQACVFVNLEQLGEGGASVSTEYLRLLETSAVVDYDAGNRTAYATCIDDVPVVPLLHAPYLKPVAAIALEDRPIDLLFIGSMNDRRRAWLDRIEALGLSVTTFDGPLYGEERDQFIVQAKAVVNAHFYESSRFEQARVAHCLSLGTPVVAERTPRTQPHAAFEDCVLWLEGEQLEQFFSEDFRTPAYYGLAREALLRFEQADPIEAYADLLAFATGFAKAHHERRPTLAWQPQRINLGSGKDYKPGWLNLDVLERAEPDLVLDLSAPLALPLTAVSPSAGPVRAGGAWLRRDPCQQRARARARPVQPDGQLPAAAQDRRRVPDRGALRTRAFGLARPHACARDERELVDLLHGVVLVPGLVRAPLRTRPLRLSRQRPEGVRPRAGRLHARAAAQGRDLATRAHDGAGAAGRPAAAG